jgi:hypothetical protein
VDLFFLKPFRAFDKLNLFKKLQLYCASVFQEFWKKQTGLKLACNLQFVCPFLKIG